MMPSIFSAAAVCALALSANGAELYRLALFDPQSTLNTHCGLDTAGQTARFFTIMPTTTCTLLPSSSDAYFSEPKYYLWNNATGKECFKAGCDSMCHTCEVAQGVCDGGSGSGSGSGGRTTTRPHVVEDDAEAVMSEELVTCGSTISGDTSYPGLSFMGNPTPDRLHTLLIEKTTTVSIDGCGSDFDTSIKVFSTDEESSSDPIMDCKGCEDCSAQLEAGEYALLVEGDESQVRTSGFFNVNVDCGTTRRARSERIPVLDEGSAPLVIDTCYSKHEHGNFTSFFVFKFNKDTDEACVLQTPLSGTNNAIVLKWVGTSETATCDARSDVGSTIVASVVPNVHSCVAEGSDGHGGNFAEIYQPIGGGGVFSVRFGCQTAECDDTTCDIHESNVLPGTCVASKLEVMIADNFHMCGVSPQTTLGPHPTPQKGGSKGSPVGAIVGSIVGAIVVGGIVFFVIRRRKQQQSTAYAVLQDDPTF